MIVSSILPISTYPGIIRTIARSTTSGRVVASRRSLSKKSKLRHAYQRSSETSVANHKLLYPESFIYRRGDHPYGTREYLLVRPKPITTDANGATYHLTENTTITSPDGTATEPSAPSQMQILASLHANNNIVFGASVNKNVMPDHATSDFRLNPPSILDLFPTLLRAALDDCSDEGEQPQALSSLHGLSAWVRQCLEGTKSSAYLQGLQEQMKHSVYASAQLECITAIATGIPRPGHTVVGKGTHRDGAIGWEALAREFALSDDAENIQLSEECLLYRRHADSCELVKIELLADTSPAYLASAGGCMARFFLQ